MHTVLLLHTVVLLHIAALPVVQLALQQSIANAMY